MQWPAVHAAGQLAICAGGRGARAIRIDADECIGARLEPGDGGQALLDQVGGFESFGP
jgi:hypothetical protein